MSFFMFGKNSIFWSFFTACNISNIILNLSEMLVVTYILSAKRQDQP